MQANVSWSAEGSSAVSFQGRRAATFAFAAVPCAIEVDGTFVFGLESSEAMLGAGPPPEPEMTPVVDQPGLLTFDGSDEPAGVPSPDA